MNAGPSALGAARRIYRRVRPNRPWLMFDAVTVSHIPRSAEAVAGYVAGNWPTYPVLVHAFPHAKKLSIAVQAYQAADCLDIEPGDATTEQAAQWFRQQVQRGVKRPVFYTSLTNAAGLVAKLTLAHISRTSYRLWIAHYTDRPHICNARCGLGFTGIADATQWTSSYKGLNLDASLCSPDFFK